MPRPSEKKRKKENFILKSAVLHANLLKKMLQNAYLILKSLKLTIEFESFIQKFKGYELGQKIQFICPDSVFEIIRSIRTGINRCLQITYAT